MESEMKISAGQLLLERFGGSFEFLRRELQSLLDAHGGENDRGTLRIGLNPKYGDGYSSCVIHRPILTDTLDFSVPLQYFSVLRRFNGAKIHAINLFGVLEEESNQRCCLSLITANQFWINGFRGIPRNSFHVGSRIYSWDETVGYFYAADGTLFSARKSGEILMTWSTLEDMLERELETARRVEIEMKDLLLKRFRAQGL